MSYVSSIGVVGARPLMPGVRPQEGAVRLVVCPLRRNVGHAGARNGCSNSSLPDGDASLDGLLTSIPTAARIAPGLLPLVRCGLYGCHTRPVNGYRESNDTGQDQCARSEAEEENVLVAHG